MLWGWTMWAGQHSTIFNDKKTISYGLIYLCIQVFPISFGTSSPIPSWEWNPPISRSSRKFQVLGKEGWPGDLILPQHPSFSHLLPEPKSKEWPFLHPRHLSRKNLLYQLEWIQPGWCGSCKRKNYSLYLLEMARKTLFKRATTMEFHSRRETLGSTPNTTRKSEDL